MTRRRFCLAAVLAACSIFLSHRLLAIDLTDTIAGSVSDGSSTLPYRLFEPVATTPTQKLPLIVYLHGIGDRGTDNVSQTIWMGGLGTVTRSGQYASYVLAPQIDTSSVWGSSTNQASAGMAMTLQAIKQVIATQNVDPSRVYITGFSLGGIGTWDALRRAPGLFAAAAPVSGAYDPSTAATMTGTPVWAWHGGADTVIDPQADRDMVAAINAAGGNAQLNELPGRGHDVVIDAYAAGSPLYAWLFSHQLGDGSSAALLNQATDLALPALAADAAFTSSGTASDATAQAATSSTDATSNFNVTPAPEPTALALLVIGASALLTRRAARR